MAFSEELLSQCWFLAGPTACGKTAASLMMAKQIGAEIIALDSMTLYRGMDIGTAKPTHDERSQVPHHLIDILDPEQEFSLAEYVSAAESICQDVVRRGRTPLFVGGTGLYLRGILRGVFEGPPADWELRRRLDAEAELRGPQSIHDRLRSIDAVSADRLHPNDLRRVIRAIEVFEVTGQPLSALQQQPARPIEIRPKRVYWLSPPREWLYNRIDCRVEQMFEQGLLDEVQTLRERPTSLSHTARQALGYKEVLDWLEQNPDAETREVNLKSIIETIQTRTRQFAKRQHTWFRNLEECQAIEIDGTETSEEIADRIRFSIIAED